MTNEVELTDHMYQYLQTSAPPMTAEQKSEIDRYIVDSYGCTGWSETDLELMAKAKYRADTGRGHIVSRTTLTHCYNLDIFERKKHKTAQEIDRDMRMDMYQVMLMTSRNMMLFKKNFDDYTLANMREVIHLLGVSNERDFAAHEIDVSSDGEASDADPMLQNKFWHYEDDAEAPATAVESETDAQASDSEDAQSPSSDPVSDQ